MSQIWTWTKLHSCRRVCVRSYLKGAECKVEEVPDIATTVVDTLVYQHCKDNFMYS